MNGGSSARSLIVGVLTGEEVVALDGVVAGMAASAEGISSSRAGGIMTE